MIKGVNKKIIEINNPDSLYFEKAVFYLRPNVNILSEEISEREIKRCISELMPEQSSPRYRLRTGRIAATILIAAAVIAAYIVLR